MSRAHDDIELSKAYRELAAVKAPAELDRKILAMAARDGRTRYGIARAWIRPVAWAATIALSVAIVLELTRQTDVTAPVAEDSTEAHPAEESVSDDFAAGNMDLLQEADERARLRAGEAQAPAAACDAADRKTAESWYVCIAALRERGLDDEADLELGRLRNAFPDFREPDPD